MTPNVVVRAIILPTIAIIKNEIISRFFYKSLEFSLHSCIILSVKLCVGEKSRTKHAVNTELQRIFTFSPLICVSKFAVSKAKIHLNFKYLRCKAVFGEEIFVYSRHKIAVILPYYKIFNEE